MLDLKKKNKGGSERLGGGRTKKIQAEKNETAYPMENFKGQVPFLLSFAYFSCDFFFFSFLERAREESHRKYSDHKKHQELGKLSEGMRKARILGKRKAFVICQKFFYLLWWSIPHGQAFHIKLGSPLSTSSLAPLLLLPMERQNTWVTCSKGTCTQSGGLQPVMSPQLLLGELCPLQLWRGKSSG